VELRRPDQSNSPADEGWRALARITWLIPALVFVLVSAVLAVRWLENRRLEQRAREEAADRERAEAVAAVEALGGASFQILHFYGYPAAIRRGQKAQLCYGVSNAKTVRLDPPVANVWPSFNRCAEIAPVKTTTYTLTAEDADGRSVLARVTLQVR